MSNTSERELVSCINKIGIFNFREPDKKGLMNSVFCFSLSG